MRRKYLFLLPVGVLAIALTYLIKYASSHSMALFNTAGPVAEKERNLMLFALALSLLVVVPVFTMLAVIAVRYREGNTKAKYTPNVDGNRRAETVWWGLPGLLILILSIVTWNSSHALDPYKPLDSTKRPLTVQVISLNWKWLFIYPEQNIAVTNEMWIPVNRPINLELTSDATMNSFWIPQLAGQIYTMPGMKTQLHLMANRAGTFRGQSANISGKGFAGMHFNTYATSQQTFDKWVATARQSTAPLSYGEYQLLAEPSEDTPVVTYQLQDDVFNMTLNKYMDSGSMPYDMHMEQR